MPDPAHNLATYFLRTAPIKTDRPSCIDLFAGAGGLAEGFRQAGFSIRSGTDIDSAAAETFVNNFPEASFFLAPIAQLSGEELLRDANLKRGELDCLIGGPPCTAFSYNNHQRSVTHVRAGLFRDYLRIVAALEPKMLVMENVPGILTIGDGAILDEMYESLGLLGYDCDARILYAEEFGVPQERRRVFFIATKVGTAEGLFPRGTHGPVEKPSAEVNPFIHRWSANARTSRRLPSVWGAIGDLPLIQNGKGTEEAKYTRTPKTEYQSRLRGRAEQLRNHVAPSLGASNLKRIGHVPQGGNWRDIPRRLLPAGMKRARESDHTKRYGRLSKRKRCCTILTKCDPHWGSYIHPEQDRAISVREAARLQSFPDRFHFFGTRSQQFVQVGNAVPPLLATAIARSVRAHLRKSDEG